MSNMEPDVYVIDFSGTEPLRLRPFSGVIDYRLARADADIMGGKVSGGFELNHLVRVSFEKQGRQSIPLFPGERLELNPDIIEEVEISWDAVGASYKHEINGAGEIVRALAGVPAAGKGHGGVFVHGAKSDYEIRS